jgi:hypothetical protein
MLGQSRKAFCDLGVFDAEISLPDGQSTLMKRLGLVVVALAVIEYGEVGKTRGDTRVFRPSARSLIARRRAYIASASASLPCVP